MSQLWESRLWETSTLKGSLLLAALAIADNADDSGVAWPGYPLIAKKTRMSIRQVPRMLKAIEASGELAIRWGGKQRGDVNTYVFLIGREQEESERLLKIIARKGDKMSLLKACQDVMLKNKGDKITMKKPSNKHDIAMSPEPLTMDGKAGWMDEWMQTDWVCQVLIALPGYNPANLKTDRAAIDAQAYDAEALQYLWEDCQAEADNPIGLFLYRAKLGMQSPRYTEACARRRDEAARQQVDEARRNAPVLPTEPDPPVQERQPYVPDPSVTQPIGDTRMTPVQVWQAAQGELQVQMTKATYDTWVKQTSIVSVNGTWKIAVPTNYAKEWWETRLLTTVKRVLHGIVGQPCEPEFVVYHRGEA